MEAKDILTLLIAIAGLILGIWNRIEQWRDRQKKLSEELPSASLGFDGSEFPASSSYSARRLVLAFSNPTDHRWIVSKIEILQPDGGLLRSTRPDDDVWRKQVKVSWVIPASHEAGNGKSDGFLAMRFARLTGLSVEPLRVAEVRVFMYEPAGKKRRRTVSAHHVQHF